MTFVWKVCARNIRQMQNQQHVKTRRILLQRCTYFRQQSPDGQVQRHTVTSSHHHNASSPNNHPKKTLPHQTSKGIPLTVNGHVQKKRSVSFTDFTYKHPLYTQPETSRCKYKYRHHENSVSDGQLCARKRVCCWVALVGGRFVRQANNRVFPAPCLQGQSSNI